MIAQKSPSTSPEEGPVPLYGLGADQVLGRFGIDRARGLTEEEAARRLRQRGRNLLRRIPPRPWRRILLDQFKSLVVALLLIAAGAATVFGQYLEGAAIAAALVINAAFGFVTEWRATQSMEALHRMGRMTASVRRNGKARDLPAELIVPGDIVLLAEGQVVPADLRLIKAENLRCNEAALTGESIPVSKNSFPEKDTGTPPLQHANIAYSGTAVVGGAAEGVVVATGMATQMGHVSGLVETAADEVTPLEQRLDRLGRRLIYLVVIISLAVALSGIAAGKDTLLMIETAIVLAIAAVPEGLPIVSTVALGRGMWRMARRNALVKRLSAVETLGATTVICTDKTGTLTENRMVLRRILLDAGDVEVACRGPQAVFSANGRRFAPHKRDDLAAALRVGVLCSNVESGDRPGAVRGDPTEVALLEAGRWAGLGRAALLEQFPEEREESFDGETRMMATVHRADGRFLVAVKGAPEAVLGACDRVLDAQGGRRALGDEGRRAWLARNEALAAEGLRVLAVAQKTVDDPEAPTYEGLTLLALAGLYDPPRGTVSTAIARCRQAGVRVVMVTGDHPATAANIARSVGIADNGRPAVITGPELDAMAQGDRAWGETLHATSVFARVAPEHKLRLVEAFQADGEVVGMTGDGVNDAPALKKADIGIAMGRRGTEVAREASDIVLKDDAMETIVMAIEQGRNIFNNIRRFVVFLLSGNLGQIIAVSATAAANAPLPLLPLQILFLNLLLDVFPALALGVAKGTHDVMRGPPRDPREPILTGVHWLAIGGFGLSLSAGLLGVFAFALLVLDVDGRTAVTMCFLTYGYARIWHVFNMRSPAAPVLDNDVIRNPYVWGAIVLCGGLLALAVESPFLERVLVTRAPTADQWMVILVASLIPLVLGQAALGAAAALQATRKGAAAR